MNHTIALLIVSIYDQNGVLADEIVASSLSHMFHIEANQVERHIQYLAAANVLVDDENDAGDTGRRLRSVTDEHAAIDADLVNALKLQCGFRFSAPDDVKVEVEVGLLKGMPF